MQAGYRTLAIYRLLTQHTDENHPMNAVEIAQRLRAAGMEVERRSIYRSLEELEAFGVDVIRSPVKKEGFYLGEREFELAELRLLMDAVQSARFIPRGKSKALLGKLAGFASERQGRALLESIFLEERAKPADERLYYSVDALCRAIRAQKQVSFQYCEYTLKKRRVPRRDGAQYVVSPYALEWNNDAYYLIGRMGGHNRFTHFRVDRMKDIELLEADALAYDDIQSGQLNPADYAKRSFSMFEGPLEQVEIRFRNALITPVLDKLGMDVQITPRGDEWFVLSTELVVSPGLTAWLAHFGGDAELLSPAHAREEIRQSLSAMLAHYRDE